MFEEAPLNMKKSDIVSQGIHSMNRYK